MPDEWDKYAVKEKTPPPITDEWEQYAVKKKDSEPTSQESTGAVSGNGQNPAQPPSQKGNGLIQRLTTVSTEPEAQQQPVDVLDTNQAKNLLAGISKESELSPSQIQKQQNMSASMNKIAPKVTNQNIQQAEQKLQENPLDDDAIYRLGYGNLQQGNTLTATNAFTAALQINPDNWKALSGLGYIDSQNKDYGGAIENYSKAVAITPPTYKLEDGKEYNNPAYADNILALANNQRLLSKDKGDGNLLIDSEKNVDHILSTDPNNVFANQIKAEIVKQKGDNDLYKEYANKAKTSYIDQQPVQTIDNLEKQWKEQHPQYEGGFWDALEQRHAEFAKDYGAITADVLDPLGYLQGNFNAAKEGWKDIQIGTTLMNQGFENPKQYMEGLTTALKGGAATTFALAMSTPSGFVFTQALHGADALTNGEASKVIMTPLESYLPKSDNSIVENLKGFGDIILNLALLHEGTSFVKGEKTTTGKLADAYTKWKDGKRLTGNETQILTEAVQQNATPQNLQKINDAVSQLPDNTPKEQVLPKTQKIITAVETNDALRKENEKLATEMATKAPELQIGDEQKIKDNEELIKENAESVKQIILPKKEKGGIENAIPKQETNEVDVRQQTTNGEAMGKGNTKPKEPAEQSKEVGAKDEVIQDIKDKIELHQSLGLDTADLEAQLKEVLPTTEEGVNEQDKSTPDETKKAQEASQGENEVLTQTPEIKEEEIKPESTPPVSETNVEPINIPKERVEKTEKIKQEPAPSINSKSVAEGVRVPSESVKKGEPKKLTGIEKTTSEIEDIDTQIESLAEKSKPIEDELAQIQKLKPTEREAQGKGIEYQRQLEMKLGGYEKEFRDLSDSKSSKQSILKTKELISNAGEKIKKTLRSKSEQALKDAGFDVQKSGLSIDDIVDVAVKAIHKAIDAGEDINEAIKKSVEKIKGTSIYKKLIEDKVLEERDVEKELAKHFSEKGDTEENTTGIKNEVTKQERKERKLDEIEIVAKRGFGDIFDMGKKMVDEGKVDPRLMAEKIVESPRALNAEESAALLYERMKLYNEHREVTENIIKAIGSKDERMEAESRIRLSYLESAIETNDKAARISGYEQGLGLAARRMMIKEDYSLPNLIQRAKAADEGEITESLRNKLSILSKELQEANKKISEYEKNANNLQASKAIKRIEAEIKSQGKKQQRKETHEDLLEERKKLFDDLKKEQKGDKDDPARSGLPFTDKMVAIIAKLAANYIKDGINTVDGVVDAIFKEIKDIIEGYDREDIKGAISSIHKLQDTIVSPTKEQPRTELDVYKNRLEKRKEALQYKLNTGSFDKPAKMPLKLDSEAVRLKADIERTKNKIDIEIRKIEQSRRTKTQKALDYLAKWRRAVLLSSVTTLGKLTTAATLRTITTPIEEAIGGIYSGIPIISKIAKKAEREGGFSSKAEAIALSQWIKKATLRDIQEVARTGKGELDFLYGNKTTLPPEALDFFGQLHGALKVAPKRAEFFRSFEKRIENAINKGVDVSDPTVQSAIASDAYLDANRAILMQDNMVTDLYRQMITSLESKAKESTSAKIGATTLKIVFPIVKIPTNFVLETTSYAGGGFKALAKIIANKGIENINSKDADYIIRNLKKQSMGLLLLSVGFVNADSIGGYYQTGEKRKKNDVEAGGLRLFGWDVPHWMLHTPALEAIQMGATLRRTIDFYSKKHKEGIIAQAAFASSVGLLGQVPFFDEPIRIGEAARSTKSAAKFSGDLARSMIVPPDVEKIAKYLDKDKKGHPIKRKADGFLDEIKSGIPYLRKDLKKK